MKNIEDIIKNNRSGFDNLEPSDGHLERFEKRLEQHNNKPKQFSWGFIMKAAVVGILVVLSSLWLYDNLYDQHSAQPLADQSLPEEVQEAHVYYSSLVDAKYEKIKSYDFKSEKQKKILLNELKEMNDTYENIKKDLKANPDDPRVINALIRYYRMKLDVMNQILNQLETLNQTTNKEKSHETTEI